MIPTRVTEHVHCARRRRPQRATGRRAWSLAAPIIRSGRLQLSVARWPIHVFQEQDYCYGIGPLALRLQRVEWAKPIPYEGDTWFEVEGTVVDRRTGEEGKNRQVLVRAGLLPKPPLRKRTRLRH
ncbi:hypothetical protein Asp14428_49860 [Actinoplanes sp. NBRC 14428]|uniref:Uncharacterized protein n=1 Tax=Pseudosporangium ferrugineum TaxID=439699 RepID=A0A2T0S6F8_9ACTN|nr:hypothetical protein [Pseudosporangium ferrugineum]PRY29019.1 hypothetical protein CLV70_107328 [Pseudosporangium ferrugineum]BCJ53511.1 hypothetical protein Asp14428_49860 [Actinoplanes sp. NBRC 14428]